MFKEKWEQDNYIMQNSDWQVVKTSDMIFIDVNRKSEVSDG